MMFKQNQDLFYQRLQLIGHQVHQKPELNENKPERSAKKGKNIISKVVNPFTNYGLQ